MADDVDLFAGINVAADPANMTDLEKKHTPVIDAPDSVAAGSCFTVTVEVGKLLAHPNERTHFVEYVDLYAGDVFLARADLSAVTTCPTVSFCVSLDKDLGPLRALERCNVHGIWAGEKAITVA